MIIRIRLTPTWELSTDHATSSYGQPVMINRTTGEGYGPADIVQPYPSYGLMPACAAVARMVKAKKLSADEAALVARFARNAS